MPLAWESGFKYARISARKVRLIIDMIRGRDVQDALNILKFSPHRASGMIAKVLTSAIASANEQEADVDRLFISEAHVGSGPTIKRFQPKDRGRAYRILKRTSHITVVVDQQQQR